MVFWKSGKGACTLSKAGKLVYWKLDNVNVCQFSFSRSGLETFKLS